MSSGRANRKGAPLLQRGLRFWNRRRRAFAIVQANWLLLQLRKQAQRPAVHCLQPGRLCLPAAPPAWGLPHTQDTRLERTSRSFFQSGGPPHPSPAPSISLTPPLLPVNPSPFPSSQDIPAPSLTASQKQGRREDSRRWSPDVGSLHPPPGLGFSSVKWEGWISPFQPSCSLAPNTPGSPQNQDAQELGPVLPLHPSFPGPASPPACSHLSRKAQKLSQFLASWGKKARVVHDEG